MTYICCFLLEFEAYLSPLELITPKEINRPEFEKIPGTSNKMHLTSDSVNILNFQKAAMLCLNTTIGKGNS